MLWGRRNHQENKMGVAGGKLLITQPNLSAIINVLMAKPAFLQASGKSNLSFNHPGTK